MGQQPNWGKLVKQNRAKAPGVPWSQKELKALNEYNIHPDYVRKGILTPEQLEEAEGIDKSLLEKDFGELVKAARDEGIMFDRNVVSRQTLIDEITRVRSKKRAEESKVEEEAKPPEKSKEPAKEAKKEEEDRYYCEKCDRNHVGGSKIYDEHKNE